MSSDEESDQEHQEFVRNFFDFIQKINQYYVNKSQERQSLKFMKITKARRKELKQINFKMPANTDENVSDIVSYNKNQAERMLKPMRNQTKNLEYSQVEPYIMNVHQILRDLKLKQQILRNVQKRVYLNLMDYYKFTKKNNGPQRRSCTHVYLAESIYADKMKEQAILKPQEDLQKILIPLFNKPCRKDSTS